MENRQASKLWGLTRSSPIWLPPGIVVPWHIDGNVWRVNIRRLSGNPKYIGPAGSRNGLYGADGLRVRPDRPVALVEGEFDALSLQQEAGDLITAVATGSTTGARRPRWIALLAQAPVVLISFDLDEAGEKAARYWLDILPQARRWKPYWEDVNAMLRDGVSLRSWLAAGLDKDLG
jgi:DNA primase